MKKLILSLFFVALFLLFSSNPTMAHVAIKPAQVGVGTFQTFTVGVPNEKDNPTTNVRLLIPEGLKHVTPNVKPGWVIEVKKSGEGEDAVVTEIVWSGGSVPAGQRDEFLFSAQVPAKETKIAWKAYQTYQDGETVEWINEPSEDHAEDAPPPYSVTSVINDLQNGTDKDHAMPQGKDKSSFVFVISIAALAMSAIALGLSLRKKK